MTSEPALRHHARPERPLRVLYYNTFLSQQVAEGLVSRQFYTAAHRLDGWELLAAIPVRGGRGGNTVRRLVGHPLRQKLRNASVIRTLRAPSYTRRATRLVEQALLEKGPFDLLLLHLSQADLVALARLCRRAQMPIVLRVPGPLSYQADHVFHRHMSPLERSEERYLYQRADAISVISSDMKKLLSDQGVEPGKIEVTPNGVDRNEIERLRAEPDSVRRQLDLGDDPVVGYVGGFWQGNDMATLMRAWRIVEAQHPRARLMLVGDGPGQRATRALAASLALERCIWAGAVPHDDVPRFLAAMTLGVGPYTREALAFVSPLKVIEYTAMGLPVVAADGGQIRELVEPGVSGLTYPAGSEQALASAILDLLASPERAKAMSRAARQRMASWPDWERVAEQILQLCRRATAVPLER